MKDYCLFVAILFLSTITAQCRVAWSMISTKLFASKFQNTPCIMVIMPRQSVVGCLRSALGGNSQLTSDHKNYEMLRMVVPCSQRLQHRNMFIKFITQRFSLILMVSAIAVRACYQHPIISKMQCTGWMNDCHQRAIIFLHSLCLYPLLQMCMWNTDGTMNSTE